MNFLLVLLPVALLMLFHFWNQTNKDIVQRSSNVWMIFYIAFYFLPIPLFLDAEDGWSTIWDYQFKDKIGSLIYATLLAYSGGMVLSFFSRLGLKTARTQSHPSITLEEFSIKRMLFVTAFVYVALLFGIFYVGGIGNLFSNLADRINLFAGLNSFFLMANLLIGVTFVAYVAHVFFQKVALSFVGMLALITLPSLIVLGQKANLFIFLIGLLSIRLAAAQHVKIWALVVAGFALANCLLLYEYIFREALIIGFDSERLTLAGWFNYFYLQVTGNFMQIQNLTVLIDAMPNDQPFLLGETYLSFFELIVPQAFIQQKPLTASGIFTLMYWPEIVARESTTMPPGLFGEAYMNFGVVGYIGLCALVGILLGRIDQIWNSTNSPSMMQIVFFATSAATSLHFIRGEYFSPFLIVVGILLGARLSIRKTPLQSKFERSNVSKKR